MPLGFGMGIAATRHDEGSQHPADTPRNAAPQAALGRLWLSTAVATCSFSSAMVPILCPHSSHWICDPSST